MSEHAKKPPINLAEIADFMSCSMPEQHVYLDTQTGQVVMLPDELIGPLLDDPDDGESDADDPAADLPQWEADLLPLARAVATDDEQRFVRFPEPDPREDHVMMRDFAATVEAADDRERLSDALFGPHPFRSFRRTLDGHPKLVKRWHAFKSSEYQRPAREWLGSLGIEPIQPQSK